MNDPTQSPPAPDASAAPEASGASPSFHGFQQMLGDEDLAAHGAFAGLIAAAKAQIDVLDSGLGLNFELQKARAHLDEALTWVRRHLNGDS